MKCNLFVNRNQQNQKKAKTKNINEKFLLSLSQFNQSCYMKVINLSQNNSVICNYLAELRDVNIHADRQKFRFNLSRIGQLMAYEISKTMQYSSKDIQTPLGIATTNIIDDNIVLGTIFRAGIPFHHGFLEIFDKADNAFLSAYRYFKDDKTKELGIHIEYMVTPDLNDRTLIIVDPMLATGGSMELGFEAFLKNGKPKTIHLCCVLASQEGVNNLQKFFKDDDNITLWCGDIDPDLDANSYIVPGLGDAGDLAFGTKL